MAAALLVSGVISFWVAQADADWANSAKQTAMLIAQRTRNESGAIWFQGHWGFQYYMQQLGMRPLDFSASVLQPGDVLAVPKNGYLTRMPPQPFVASEEVFETRLRQPVMLEVPDLGAGFYAAFSTGWLPFRVGAAPAEGYSLFRIAETLRPEDWQHRKAAPRDAEE